MVNRVTTWLLVLWTAGMALGITAAFLGIGDDCAGLAGAELTACQADAWARGSVGLGLLVVLWLVVAVPLAVVWFRSRPKRQMMAGGGTVA